MDCVYCGKDNNEDDFEHHFDDSFFTEEAEIKCRFCKKTMLVAREFQPVYYPTSIEYQIKGQAEIFKQMVDAYKTDGPMPDWAERLLTQKKEVIKELGELIKKNRLVNNGTAK